MQDDDILIKSALKSVQWPEASPHLKARIMAAIETDTVASLPPAYMMKPASWRRAGAFMSLLLVLVFLFGMMAGSGRDETESSDPLYTDSGTILMAQLLE